MLAETAEEMGYTPEQIAEAEARLAAVNLDEVVDTTISVAISEIVTETYQTHDGRDAKRNKRVGRVVELIGDVDAETQLHVLALAQQRPDSKDPRILSEFLAKQVLLAWQMTEPDMTLERLLKGLDLTRLRKLADAFFK